MSETAKNNRGQTIVGYFFIMVFIAIATLVVLEIFRNRTRVIVAGAATTLGADVDETESMITDGPSWGVVLDISGSMSPYVALLRVKIANEFSDASCREITGCSLLTREDEDLWDGPCGYPACWYGGEYDDTLEAIEELVEEGVDTIYWFCDLQDPESDRALEALNKLLEQNHVKLYIRSFDKSPNSQLREIVEKSGGDVGNRIPAQTVSKINR